MGGGRYCAARASQEHVSPDVAITHRNTRKGTFYGDFLGLIFLIPPLSLLQFEEIHAQMTSKGLTLRYPNMRCYRVDARSSGNS